MKVLSLGAGVQSTALFLMYSFGVLSDPPGHAIFADTRGEPAEVYSWLEKLKKVEGGIPITAVSRGALLDESGKIPFFLKHPDGKKGMAWRQCTRDYKIDVVRKEIRKMKGLRPRQHYKGEAATVVLGISTDEAQRRKDSPVKWIRHEYPLLDIKKMSRKDCISYVESTGVGTPPRSACVYCPYRTDAEWADMKKNDSEAFAVAVSVDKGLRDGTLKSKYKAERYVHSSLMPLDKADFSQGHKIKTPFGAVATGMNNECDGMCGT